MARVAKTIEIERPLRMLYERCRVSLALEYDPKGFVEKVGDALGVVSRRVEGDLERFKRFVEERPSETGAWRGEITPGGGVEPRPNRE
jgi:hypothetical protein